MSVEEIRKLIFELWDEGLSAGQISTYLAKHHVHKTRNAVIGIVHRHGGEGRRRVQGSSRRAYVTNCSPGPRVRAPTPPKPAPVVIPDEIPNGEKVANGCLWPIGDPQDKEYHDCGLKRRGKGPYCELHARKAYQPGTSRRVYPERKGRKDNSRVFEVQD